MENVFLHLLNMSLSAAVLVVVVVLLRLAFYKAPRWIHCLLWTLVAVRLLCPFTLESSLSLMPDTEAALSGLTEQFSAEQKEGSDAPTGNPPVIDIPVTDAPVADTPVIDTPVIDTPVIDTPVTIPTPEASVSTPTPEASVDPWQIAVVIASYVWVAGIAAMAIYAALTTLRLRHQVGEAARLTDRVWCCDHIRTPFILGVFRPRIYLPSDLSGTARDSVLAHEQAHLHRRDHWWKPLGFILLTVYWFNPLMWVAYVLLCRDIEAACDERVVRDMTAPDRKAYSEALLLCSAPRRLISACPLAFGETSVKSRIKSVLSYKKPTVWIIVAALLISTVAGVCLLTDPKSDDPDSQTSTTDKDDPSDITTDGSYWVTYSHSFVVGSEGEPAVGKFRLEYDFPDELRQLVDNLNWYGADAMADASFGAMGYFTFDGMKKYYVSADCTTLFDGEQIADLTVDQGATMDYLLREGVPIDAATASVIGTVVEWNKAGGYFVLDITEGDAKLGKRVRIYTCIMPAGSPPAVGYSATVYYDGYYEYGDEYSIIYAIYRAPGNDADLMGGLDDPTTSITTPPTTSATSPTTTTSTTTGTKPTAAPTTNSSVSGVAAPSTDIATCVDGDYYYFVPRYQTNLYRRNLAIEDPSAPGALEKGMNFGDRSDLRVSDGRVYYIESGCLYSCRFDGTDTLLVDGDETLLSYDIAGDWIFSVKKTAINVSQREVLCVYRKDGSQRKVLTTGKNYAHSYVTVYGFNRGKCYYYWEVSVYTGPDVPSSSDDMTYDTDFGYYTVDYRQSNLEAVTWKMKMPMGWHESLKEQSLHNDYFSASVYGRYKFYNVLTDEVVEASGGVGRRLNDYTVRLQNKYSFISPYVEVATPYLEFTDYTGKSTSVDLPVSFTATYDGAILCTEQNQLGNMACVFQYNETTGDCRMILVGVDKSYLVLYTESGETK